MKILLIYYLLLLFVVPVRAQQLISATPVGGGIYSTHFNNAFSADENAASLATIHHFSAGIFSENRFHIKGLGLAGFAIAVPVASARTFGFSGKLYGDADYRESRLSILYAMPLSKWLSIGISGDYYHSTINGYGSMSAATFDAGVLFHISKKMIGGISLSNPAQIKFNKLADQKITTVYSAGIGYEPSKEFFINLQIKKQPAYPLYLLINFRYQIAQSLILEAGINTFQPEFFGGFIINIKSLQIMVNAAFHQQLGLTPGAAFIYNQIKE